MSATPIVRGLLSSLPEGTLRFLRGGAFSRLGMRVSPTWGRGWMIIGGGVLVLGQVVGGELVRHEVVEVDAPGLDGPHIGVLIIVIGGEVEVLYIVGGSGWSNDVEACSGSRRRGLRSRSSGCRAAGGSHRGRRGPMPHRDKYSGREFANTRAPPRHGWGPPG